VSDFTRSRELVVALITVSLIGFLGVAAVWPLAKRRPVGAPLSWGQAMGGATYVFFLMLWWYGIIPHQWLTYSSSELGWTSQNLWVESNAWWPVTITYEVVGDLIVLLIYGVGLGFHVGAWAIWQDRGKPKPTEVPASRYGRPLVREP
jgi:hypothetical protein